MGTINSRLKKLRENSGLRQEQIADYLGVTQTYISKVESGERNLTVDQMENVANLYGYSLSSIMQNENSDHPITFAFRAQEVSQDDLHAIADISRIAINSKFMKNLLGGLDDRQTRS